MVGIPFKPFTGSAWRLDGEELGSHELSQEPSAPSSGPVVILDGPPLGPPMNEMVWKPEGTILVDGVWWEDREQAEALLVARARQAIPAHMWMDAVPMEVVPMETVTQKQKTVLVARARQAIPSHMWMEAVPM